MDVCVFYKLRAIHERDTAGSMGLSKNCSPQQNLQIHILCESAQAEPVLAESLTSSVPMGVSVVASVVPPVLSMSTLTSPISGSTAIFGEFLVPSTAVSPTVWVPVVFSPELLGLPRRAPHR